MVGNASVTVSAASAPSSPDTSSPGEPSTATNCASRPASWIWCDDFEQDRLSSYFEYVSDGGSFVRAAGSGRNGSVGMRARYAAGQVSAGSLKLALGRTPAAAFRPVDDGATKYRELYWRFYLRNQAGWTGGGGAKLSRATIFTGSNWQQAAIGHVWSTGTGGQYLGLDPASGTDEAGNVLTTTYNDFPHLRWLGLVRGTKPIFSSPYIGQWHCIEARMRLNNSGRSNGVFELWIDGALDARATGLNWVGNYSAYGINAVFLENYWNAGSPVTQERYLDDFVVATTRIGC